MDFLKGEDWSMQISIYENPYKGQNDRLVWADKGEWIPIINISIKVKFSVAFPGGSGKLFGIWNKNANIWERG